MSIILGFFAKYGLELIIPILLAIYEVVVSFFPTVKNYSIISFGVRILRLMLPNKSKGGGVFREVPIPKDMKLKFEGEKDEKKEWSIETSETNMHIDNSHGGFIKKLKIISKNK